MWVCYNTYQGGLDRRLPERELFSGLFSTSELQNLRQRGNLNLPIVTSLFDCCLFL